MPFDGNRWNDKKMVSYQELVAMIHQKYPDFQRCQSQDTKNDTSKAWKVPGFQVFLNGYLPLLKNVCPRP